MIFGVKSIEQALNTKVIVDYKLQEDRQLWRSMMDGKAYWNDDDNPSLRLASSISKEVARLSTFEFESEITSSERADYLNKQYQKVIENLIDITKELVSSGSIVLKPYVRGNKILVTTVTNDCFYPLEYNEIGEITSIVFADTIKKEDKFFTLLEKHTWDEENQTYEIFYKSFESNNQIGLGFEVPLTAVKEWANLNPNLKFINIEQPLFVECNMNKYQSIFAEAVDIIKQADMQFGRTLWEYLGSELAVHADLDLFKKDSNNITILPQGKERLYKIINADLENFTLDVFSPQIRDDSLFRGLNEIKRIIESIVGFAYGILSDPQQRDKTAQEVKAGSHRLLVTIKTIQKILENTFKKLVISMDIMASIYNLAPQGSYEMNLTWGDSVLEDPDKEYARRKELVAMGILKPEALYSWYFGVSEDEALKQMPELDFNEE